MNIKNNESKLVQYPVLTYGTLRPGCGNYRAFLEGFTISEETVTLTGFRMHGSNGFPYIIFTGNEEDITVATLNYLIPDVETYAEVLQGLDFLEGFRGPDSKHNHYDRILHTFEANGVTRQAWLYVAMNSFSMENALSLPVIKNGDWLNRPALTEHAKNYVGSSFIN